MVLYTCITGVYVGVTMVIKGVYKRCKYDEFTL